MKWLSVKKYKPYFVDTYVFVVDAPPDEAQTFEIAIYDGMKWFLHNGVQLRHVTHFCIPDPVEIEEE